MLLVVKKSHYKINYYCYINMCFASICLDLSILKETCFAEKHSERERKSTCYMYMTNMNKNLTCSN